LFSLPGIVSFLASFSPSPAPISTVSSQAFPSNLIPSDYSPQTPPLRIPQIQREIIKLASFSFFFLFFIKQKEKVPSPRGKHPLCVCSEDNIYLVNGVLETIVAENPTMGTEGPNRVDLVISTTSLIRIFLSVVSKDASLSDELR
ncbi:hypothetical protein VIGAN_01074200, partial [Vigna angularis var. angularis]